MLNSEFTTDTEDRPRVVRHQRVGLGIAVDVERADGSRSLVVPCVRDADTLGFEAFWAAYEDKITKVRDGALTPDDFAGTTVTLTNPGTIGTVQSVPRLMVGQGAIIGVGAIGYGNEFEGADPDRLAELGMSKVVTISSTYDHRVIQGAESGLFLQRVHELLLGEHGFYEDVFESLGVPHQPAEWHRDVNPSDREDAAAHKQIGVNRLINAHRVRGHLLADLDPLATVPEPTHPELDPATYGLSIWDLDRVFLTGGLSGEPVGGTERLTLERILDILRNAYCGTVGVEYMHIQDPEEKRWLQARLEGVDQTLPVEDQGHILDRLNAAEALEQFLARKYVGQKRFGLEGGESAIPLLDAVLSEAADTGMHEVVMGMAHRGRLNMLVNVLGASYHDLFARFEDLVDPLSIQGTGDVKYHLGSSGTFVAASGASIPIELAANPSHLEAVDPVVLGMVRAKQDRLDDAAFSVLPLLVHGDAAFAGQGVVAETLNLSMLEGYRVGGTIHVIIDNKLGFTTPVSSARSSVYPTDVAKMVQAPIFHVNGDDPEACVRVARLAFAYRQQFQKDVVIDMVCYRRRGHNEADDPSYTQPLTYRAIDQRLSVRERYTTDLVARGDLSLVDADAARADFEHRLAEALDQTRRTGSSSEAVPVAPTTPEREPANPHTGVDRDTLDQVYEALCTPPRDFTIHPKLARQFEARDALYEQGTIDWALAESLAFGSLLIEGRPIRVTGQDTRRGTFSQRHACLVDYDTEAEWFPLDHVSDQQGSWSIHDSLLSEYAALGFEYGYSVASPETLVCWEAQFGDFANGAQIIIDQFIVAAEDKWSQRSGLVMLLPHGFEGQGPEHSSARIERFMLLAAERNLRIVNATTAAQYFHVLRRQARSQTPKPLVLFTPKSLLRASESKSSLDELTMGSFSEVIGDPGVDPGKVSRVVLASGKVAVEAIRQRDELRAPVAVLRIEQLYPWPHERLEAALGAFPDAEELVWLQEEPENMGAWNAVKGHLYGRLDGRYWIRRVSRRESGSPATGSAAVHAHERAELLGAALT